MCLNFIRAKYFLSTLCFIIYNLLFAQSVITTKITNRSQGKEFNAFLNDIERQFPVRFFYLPEWFSGLNIQNEYSGQELRMAITDVLKGSDFSFFELNAHTIIFIKDPTHSIQLNSILRGAAQEQLKVEKYTMGTPSMIRKDMKYNITGNVKGSKNEPLGGAHLNVEDLGEAYTADDHGNFRFQLPQGEHYMYISFVNYEKKMIAVSCYSDGEINIVLDETPTMLEEVVVRDNANEAVTSNIGQIQLSVKEIKRAPSLMGEVDIIKQIQVLPGVTTAGEAASGYNVRGGTVDQNLILYDGMPVFNSSHVFGFFSAFNSEAIKDLSFYRGGIPSEFGGRVSSVLDIRSKSGDFVKWSGGGGIGLITSNVHVDGPLIKDKTTIAISARTTYSNWLVNSIRTNYADLSKSTVTFYDASLKLTHRFNSNTKIMLSTYISQDQFRLKGDSAYKWSNFLSSIVLEHSFSNRLSSSLHAGYGTYGYDLQNQNPYSGFDLFYKITYPSLKADLRFHSEKHKVNFGVQGIYYAFEPGTFNPLSLSSGLPRLEIERQRSIESGVYASDNITLTDQINLEAGLRFSTFSSLGPGTVNLYKPAQPLELPNLEGSKTYTSSDIIKTYSGLEPRFSFRYTVTPNSSVKIGFNRIYQYLHLVTNTTAVTPVDIWQPSGYYFKPQKADQISVGYFKDFKNKTYDGFIEMYYKEIDNILDFKDGAKLILNDKIETALLQGKGTAYGIETQFSKLIGRLTGSFSYTYSRSLRQIAGPTSSESINDGKTYPSNFDQPHSINIAWKYAISKRIYFTGNFTYRTGRPITLPVNGFSVDDNYATSFSDRNSYRIPDYHRLDFALVLEGNHKRKKRVESFWAFSIYNVYGRKNPYTIFFKGAQGSTLIPYQLSIIGTALPSLTWNLKF